MGGQFGINSPNALLKILKLSKTRAISKFSKIMRVIYPQNCLNQTWLQVNHTKPTNTLCWNWYLLTGGNYKSVSGHLENSWQLQNNTINSAMSKMINQVIYFLTSCFTFLTKFWMLQVRKSHSCRISAIFFQCCFMTETQWY